MSCQIFKETSGVRIKVTVNDCLTDSPKNISLATGFIFVFKKPSGSNLEVTPSFLTNGTDGVLYYDTLSTDLDEIGIWQLQVVYSLGTNTVVSSIAKFTVYKQLRS